MSFVTLHGPGSPADGYDINPSEVRALVSAASETAGQTSERPDSPTTWVIFSGGSVRRLDRHRVLVWGEKDAVRRALLGRGEPPQRPTSTRDSVKQAAQPAVDHQPAVDQRNAARPTVGAMLAAAIKVKAREHGAGFSLRSIAAETATDHTYLGRVIRGTRRPSPTMLKTWATVLAPHFDLDQAMIAAGFVPDSFAFISEMDQRQNASAEALVALLEQLCNSEHGSVVISRAHLRRLLDDLAQSSETAADPAGEATS